VETKTTYFEKPGAINTEATFRLVQQRAGELGIKTILVASTTGRTAVKAVDFFQEFKLIAVSLAFGSREQNSNTFTEENRKALAEKGGLLLTSTHAFGGVSRALNPGATPNTPLYLAPTDIIAATLRIFSQGMKVVCEIAVMAADAGLVRIDEEIIAVAGTSGGADTACVIKPSNGNHFFDLRVKEIICKPRL
jgi:hypothetical protein